MVIKLDLKSKNLKSLKRFLIIFNKFCVIYDSESMKLTSNKKIKKVLFSVLKSPHVNKSAQEQFEFKLYNTRLIIYSKSFLKILLCLKFLSKKFFSDIQLKVSVTVKQKQVHNANSFYFKKINSSYLISADINGERLFL
jgi:ribosomal protein S10